MYKKVMNNGNASPYDIGLLDEILERGRLRLVESAFGKSPSKSVDE